MRIGVREDEVVEKGMGEEGSGVWLVTEKRKMSHGETEDEEGGGGKLT
jgi:hypothetical protein